jgi:hypothetical protein
MLSRALVPVAEDKQRTREPPLTEQFMVTSLSHDRFSCTIGWKPELTRREPLPPQGGLPELAR